MTDITEILRSIASTHPSDSPHAVKIGEAAAEIQRLRDENANLTQRIQDASILLWDWDGYWNPDTGTGNARELAGLIESAYTLLQNESWRKSNE